MADKPQMWGAFTALKAKLYLVLSGKLQLQNVGSGVGSVYQLLHFMRILWSKQKYYKY